MFTPKQLKAARAMAGLSIEQLAKEAGLNKGTIANFENNEEKINLRNATTEQIVNALAAHRIEFTPNGVQEKQQVIQLLEGEDTYLKVLDDIMDTLAAQGEALFFCVNNRLSSPAVVQRQVSMRRAGIRMRFTAEHGDTYLRYPLEEYRWMPTDRFINIPVIVYQNKVAIALQSDCKRMMIVDNDQIAEQQRQVFNIFWEIGEQPPQSTAEERYV